MVGFFEELARERDGWPGRKAWESEYAEVTTVAEHAGDRVTLRTHLSWPPNYDREHRAVLSVSPGELPKLAEQVRALTGIEDGRRFIRPAFP